MSGVQPLPAVRTLRKMALDVHHLRAGHGVLNNILAGSVGMNLKALGLTQGKSKQEGKPKFSESSEPLTKH